MEDVSAVLYVAILSGTIYEQPPTVKNEAFIFDSSEVIGEIVTDDLDG